MLANKLATTPAHDARPSVRILGKTPRKIAMWVIAGVVNSNFMERAAFRGPKGYEQRATMERMLASPPPGLVQTPEEVAQQIYNAAVNYKEEVFVGPAYNIINALYRSTNVNPFSMAPPQ